MAICDRRELLRMLNRLAPGDMVTVTRIDRLSRSINGTVKIGPFATRRLATNLQRISHTDPGASQTPA